MDRADFQPLRDIISGFHLMQLINEPTHRARALDLIFLGRNLSLTVISSGISSPIEKHHCLVWCHLLLRSSNVKEKRRIIFWSWKDADWDRAKFSLQYNSDGTRRTLVHEVLAEPTVSDSVAALNNIIMNVLNRCVPHQTRKMIQKPVPWFSKQIARLIRQRDQAFAYARRSADSGAWSEFKRLRKQVKCTIRTAKRKQFSDSFDCVKTSGDFWRAFRKANGSRAEIPSLVRPDGSFAVRPDEKAQLLADSFAGSWNTVDCSPPTFPSEVFIEEKWTCTVHFVQKQIQKLRTSTPTGLDGIPVQMVKACSAELAPAIAAICNRALNDGQFPALWKLARVTALQKKPAATDPTDFRPISILPVISKIAEHWLLTILHPYIQLSPLQFAYCHGRSTEDALLFLQTVVAKGFECCKRSGSATKVAAVSIDIAKAFDSVPKNALLSELQQQWSVPVPIIRLLEDYLSGRKQLVRVNGSDSSATVILSGVAQGSIIGGLLFIAYVNSILNLRLSRNSTPIMFADDLLLLNPLPTSDSEQQLQHDLDLIFQSYQNLFLKINPIKSKWFLFSLASAAPELVSTPNIGGTSIERTESLVYLGFVLDRRLTFSAHTSCAVSKGKRALGALHRAFGRIAGREVFGRLVQAKIMPIFLYGLAAAFPVNATSIVQLERLNKFAARLALNNYTASYFELLQELQWKDVSRLCFERRACLAFKYIYSMRHLPGEMLQMAVPHARQSVRIFSNRNNHELQLVIPLFSYSATDRLPIYQIFHVWNNLPGTVISLTDFGAFKDTVHSPIVFSMIERKIPEVIRCYSDI